MKKVAWLVVNSDGDITVRKTQPYLKYNEVRFKLTLDIPQRLMTAGEIELHLPAMPVPEIEVQEFETADAV